MVLVARNADDFFQRRVAAEDPTQAVIAQIQHAVALCLFTQLLVTIMGVDLAAQSVIHNQQFVDARASAITDVAACSATFRAVQLRGFAGFCQYR